MCVCVCVCVLGGESGWYVQYQHTLSVLSRERHDSASGKEEEEEEKEEVEGGSCDAHTLSEARERKEERESVCECVLGVSEWLVCTVEGQHGVVSRCRESSRGEECAGGA